MAKKKKSEMRKPRPKRRPNPPQRSRGLDGDTVVRVVDGMSAIANQMAGSSALTPMEHLLGHSFALDKNKNLPPVAFIVLVSPDNRILLIASNCSDKSVAITAEHVEFDPIRLRIENFLKSSPATVTESVTIKLVGKPKILRPPAEDGQFELLIWDLTASEGLSANRLRECAEILEIETKIDKIAVEATAMLSCSDFDEANLEKY